VGEKKHKKTCEENPKDKGRRRKKNKETSSGQLTKESREDRKEGVQFGKKRHDFLKGEDATHAETVGHDI